jgi:hypothetical protein
MEALRRVKNPLSQQHMTAIGLLLLRTEWKAIKHNKKDNEEDDTTVNKILVVF